MREKTNLTLSVHPEVRDRLEQLARDRRVSLSKVVEDLVDDAFVTEQHYWLRHAALHSFVGTAMLTALLQKSLGKEEAARLRSEVQRVSGTLFGGPPPRRSDDAMPPEADPRIQALFAAYGLE